MKMCGLGCTNECSGMPVHNPQPSTERGKRRHANRSEDKKKRAENAWKTNRAPPGKGWGIRGRGAASLRDQGGFHA